MIDNFKTFNEKLGIVSGLETIADDIISYFQNNEKSFYVKEVEIDGIKTSLTIFLNKDYPNPCFFIDEGKFKIRLNKLSKPVLIHELKHLHRYIKLNVSSNINWTKWTLTSNSIDKLSSKLSYLFKSKNFASALYVIIYFADQNEFESYYNEIYHKIKNNISQNLNREDKIDFIKKELENDAIFKVYKSFYKKDLDIDKFFKSEKYKNIFLSEVENLRNNIKGDMVIPRPFIKFSTWIKSLSNKNFPKQKIEKEIVKMVRKSIDRNYKKFWRLYTLLT